jgi:hypothetical protein
MATLYSDRRLSDDERRRRGDTCCNGTQHCIAIVTDLAAVVRWSVDQAMSERLSTAAWLTPGPAAGLTQRCPAPVTRVEALMIFFNSTQVWSLLPGSISSPQPSMRCAPSPTAPAPRSIRTESARTRMPERFIHPKDVASVIVSLVMLPHTSEGTEIRMRPSFPAAPET